MPPSRLAAQMRDELWENVWKTLVCEYLEQFPNAASAIISTNDVNTRKTIIAATRNKQTKNPHTAKNYLRLLWKRLMINDAPLETLDVAYLFNTTACHPSKKSIENLNCLSIRSFAFQVALWTLWDFDPFAFKSRITSALAVTLFLNILLSVVRSHNSIRTRGLNMK